ncbi:MAG: glutathione peroxidase [Bacillota bacterium]|nr:glutathione peroxidase [Bacillota bacterium]
MSIYDISVRQISGETISLFAFKNKVLLIVNTACKCKLVTQLRDLEGLYNKYKHQDFVVLAFPCNQFAGQEPLEGEEIRSLCEVKFGVTFPIFSKIEVNGEGESPLYTFLKSRQKGFLNDNIKWNFTKFLIDRNGEVIKRFSPLTSAQDIESYILNNDIL